ncbi:hypothetical protein SKAU_G00299550 [Synaphobranchus kaupii]|uniref:Uncharacterized protein n=1 Tax=Synaphobranchus kaupii TaxID=118154 RepID=A0A9Q1IM62_SYNKA|nr:hypothetical protein SKAU_G00299550 [Synaphobranchus kaupii]
MRGEPGVNDFRGVEKVQESVGKPLLCAVLKALTGSERQREALAAAKEKENVSSPHVSQTLPAPPISASGYGPGTTSASQRRALITAEDRREIGQDFSSHTA